MTAAVATTSAAARSTSAATTSAASAARSATTSAAISATIRAISRRTVAGHTRNRIPVEVRFVIGEISSPFDSQRRGATNFAIARLAALRCGFATTHLRPLLLEDRLA